MRFLPEIMLVLSFPAGILGYTLGMHVMSSLPLSEDTQGFLVLVVPLFVAGLFMLPFLVPFFDRKAKQDLAAYIRSQEPADDDSGDAPDGE